MPAAPATDGAGYPVVVERSTDGGFGAWSPDLPGCVALGDTLDDCRREMREAVAFHLEGLRLAGEPVPPPTAVAAEVVAAPAD